MRKKMPLDLDVTVQQPTHQIIPPTAKAPWRPRPPSAGKTCLCACPAGKWGKPSQKRNAHADQGPHHNLQR
eukprot:CAMPEP_0204356818 /NCGR_PEP_ID=MMETSP0469-20131031/35230_1 /ASSEMBLY_ACC=CAM_ASM_000384 /TAXON_ID=2969 /ORGANISM="Oxyrrhis marina" /LENGTH=70 /DNA_ID=CAMNT_0051344343 /DNA_START=88 /DNA_END=300 /DNA_ORIENTATION=-